MQPRKPKAELWTVSRAGPAEGHRRVPTPPHSLISTSAPGQASHFSSACSLNLPASPWLFTAGKQVGDKGESGIGSGNQTTQ